MCEVVRAAKLGCEPKAAIRGPAIMPSFRRVKPSKAVSTKEFEGRALQPLTDELPEAGPAVQFSSTLGSLPTTGSIEVSHPCSPASKASKNHHHKAAKQASASSRSFLNLVCQSSQGMSWRPKRHILWRTYAILKLELARQKIPHRGQATASQALTDNGHPCIDWVLHAGEYELPETINEDKVETPDTSSVVIEAFPGTASEAKVDTPFTVRLPTTFELPETSTFHLC
ncbi:hypothetical protein WJX82_004880 [Trebouxia sp. C0006]